MRRPLLSLTCVLVVIAKISDAAEVCTNEEKRNHPVLCHMLQRSEDDLDAFVQEVQEHAARHGLLVGQNWNVADMSPVKSETKRRGLRRLGQQLPVVFAHGMVSRSNKPGSVLRRYPRSIKDTYPFFV